MRSLRIIGAVSALVLLAAPAWAGISLKGQIKGQRERGRLTAITVGNQFTMTRGGKLLLHRNGAPGYLQSLGASRITAATPTQDGRFEVSYQAIRGTPLYRMSQFMERLGHAPRIGAEKLPTERFTIGGPGVGGPGEIGQFKVSMKILVGESVLTYGYAKELTKGRGLRAPSYNNYLREPAGR